MPHSNASIDNFTLIICRIHFQRSIPLLGITFFLFFKKHWSCGVMPASMPRLFLLLRGRLIFRTWNEIQRKKILEVSTMSPADPTSQSCQRRVVATLFSFVSLETDIIFDLVELKLTHWKFKKLNVNNAKIDNLCWLRTIFHTDVSPKILIREDADKDSFQISNPVSNLSMYLSKYCRQGPDPATTPALYWAFYCRARWPTLSPSCYCCNYSWAVLSIWFKNLWCFICSHFLVYWTGIRKQYFNSEIQSFI